MIKIRQVARPHYVTAGARRGSPKPPKKLALKAKRVWTLWGLRGCAGAVVATLKRQLIAFLRFDLRRRAGRRELWAHGSWVEPNRRGSGLATRLWISALRRNRPERVRVTVVSRLGLKLVRKLRGLFPKLGWSVIEYVE